MMQLIRNGKMVNYSDQAWTRLVNNIKLTLFVHVKQMRKQKKKKIWVAIATSKPISIKETLNKKNFE